MGIDIKPLTPTLATDYIGFMGDHGFTDHAEWSNCYCLDFGMTPADTRRRQDLRQAMTTSNPEGRMALNCSLAELVTQYVSTDRLHGYLAYAGDQVVGWCNADEKSHYLRFNAWDEAADQFVRDHTIPKTKAITCFLIDPDHRGLGVATALLDRVIADATAAGFAAVEGYPRPHTEYDPYDFTGPQAMYERAGFVLIAESPGVTVMRKVLG